MNSRADRIESHFAVCAAATAAAAMLAGKNADAAIFYSGIVNITITGNFAGVYLNMITGQTGTSASAGAWRTETHLIEVHQDGTTEHTEDTEDEIGLGNRISADGRTIDCIPRLAVGRSLTVASLS